RVLDRGAARELLGRFTGGSDDVSAIVDEDGLPVLSCLSHERFEGRFEGALPLLAGGELCAEGRDDRALRSASRESLLDLLRAGPLDRCIARRARGFGGGGPLNERLSGRLD